MDDMKYYGGYSLFESFNLPVGLRRYLYQKLVKRLEDEKEAIEKARNKGRRTTE